MTTKERAKMSDAKKLTQDELEMEVKGIVDGLVGKGEMFTAFDVTRRLRADGFWVEHRDVKDVVHGMFERGSLSGTGYVRTLVPVPSKSPAFVYHLYTQNAQDYDPTGAHDAALPTGVGCANLRSGPTLVAKPIKVDGICSRDKFRRVNVPNALVYAIGLKVGDRAKIYGCDGDKFMIIREHDANTFSANAMTSYIVNCRGNIRFSGRILDELDAACDSFTARLDPTNSFIWLERT